MINYFYENVAPISDEEKRAEWLEKLILEEGKNQEILIIFYVMMNIF